MYITRHIRPVIQQLMSQFPAVLLTGPRQVGKSTLLQHIASPQFSYISLDDPQLLAQAKEEPRLFLKNIGEQAVIDEVQYAPEIFSLLKLTIDQKRQNGLYFLSGSQAFELMQNVSESLAGRVAILKLSGLSLREIRDDRFNHAFTPSEDYLQKRALSNQPIEDIWSIIHRGYMPRLYEQETNRDIYYSSYVATYIERDVRQLTQVSDIYSFSKFMVAVAARSGELLNYSSIAQDAGVSIDTVKRWLAILQTSGIVYLLIPYSNNHLKRAIKTPKLYMLDTGLMAWLSKWLSPETIQHGAKSGQFFETFVVSEIVKSFYNQGMEPPLYYYRDTNQREVDLLIEYDKTLYPVAIKTTASPTKKMVSSFEVLRKYLAPSEVQIAHGTLINQYPDKLWLSEDAVAIPVSYI